MRRSWVAGLFALLAVGCGRTPLDSGTLDIVSRLPELAKVSETFWGSLAAVSASGACEWSAQGLPPGLALRPEGPAATLRGIPERSGDYDFEIRVRDPAGREASRGFRLKVRPRAWLAFRVSNADGSGETRVVDSDHLDAAFVVTLPPIVGSRDWSWSPAGDLFAFVSGSSNRAQVYLVDLRGLSPAPAVPVGAPAAIERVDFTPGGRALLSRTSEELFMAPLVAGAPGPALKLIAVPESAYFMGTAISADGDWLMVRGRLRSQAIELLAVDLNVLNVEAPAMPVPIHPPLVPGGNVSAWGFSPDGRWAMYEADAEQDDRFELYVVDAQARDWGAPKKLNPPLPPGGDVGNAAPGDELDWSWPSWAPDSSKVAFMADAERDGDSALYVAWVGLSLNTSKVSQPFAVDRELGDFMWADSDRLLYWSLSRSGGADQLMLVDTAASPPTVQTLATPIMGTIVRVVTDPMDRGVLYANGVSFDWISWYWQDWKGSAPRKVYGSVEWSWGLYEPLFSAEGALLFTTDGVDWTHRTGAELYWSAMGPVEAAQLIQGRASGGATCEAYTPTCRRFWRKDGRKLAYLTSGGELHLVDTASGSPSQAQVITAPQGAAVLDFSWP